MYSVQSKNTKIARLLLDNRANINEKDIDGFTALAICTDSGNIPMCKLLLEYSPNIDVYYILIQNPSELLTIMKTNGDNNMFKLLKEYYLKGRNNMSKA